MSVFFHVFWNFAWLESEFYYPSSLSPTYCFCGCLYLSPLGNSWISDLHNTIMYNSHLSKQVAGLDPASLSVEFYINCFIPSLSFLEFCPLPSFKQWAWLHFHALSEARLISLTYRSWIPGPLSLLLDLELIRPHLLLCVSVPFIVPEIFAVFIFYFWLCRATRRILVHQPEIEPMPSALEALSPNCWISREIPENIYFN